MDTQHLEDLYGEITEDQREAIDAGTFDIRQHPLAVKITQTLEGLGHQRPGDWIQYAHNRIMTGETVEIVGILNDYLRRAIISGELIHGDNTAWMRTQLFQLGISKQWFAFVTSDVLPYLATHQLPKITSNPVYLQELAARQAAQAQAAQSTEVQVETAPAEVEVATETTQPQDDSSE